MAVDELLRRVPLFTLTTEEQLNELIENSNQITVEANTVIFKEGDEPDGLYIVLDGQVRVYLTDDEEPTEVELDRLGPGEIIGQLAVLVDAPRTVSVSTVTKVDLLHVGEEAFLDLFVHSRSFLVYEMLRDLVGSIRENSRRIMQEELNRQRMRAEMEIARHRALNQMVAGLAHEINTPLGIVNTAASLISHQFQSPEFAEHISDPAVKDSFSDIIEAANLIQRNISRAHRLVRAFKKISVSQLIDKLEDVDLPQLIEEVIELFKINAKRAGLTIIFENNVPQGKHIWRGYPGYISQVLMNLFTNIERYAYPEGQGGEVKITVSQSKIIKEGFRIVVRDFGAGISKEAQERIYEPFYTTGRDRGGTGLGLTIVYNIVTEPLQGHIMHETAPGEGTTFFIDLPAEIAEDPEGEGRSVVSQ